MWLTGRLVSDFKTIADFRRDYGKTIRNVCWRFVVLCRVDPHFVVTTYSRVLMSRWTRLRCPLT